jgi:oligosaccharide repeat unit polymerase
MSDWTTVALAIAQILTILVFAGAHLRARTFDPFAPFWPVLLAQGLTFGLRPILLCYDQPRFGAFYPYVSFDEDGFHFASICGLISTVMLITGYRLSIRKQPIRLRLEEAATPMQTTVLCVIGMVLAVAAVSSMVGRSRVSFDTGEILTGQARGEIGRNQPGHGYLTFAWVCVPFYAAALTAAYARRDKPRFTLIAAVTLTALGILLPIGGRSLMTETAALVLYVVHYRIRPLPFRASLAFAVGAFTVSSLMGNLRSGLWGERFQDSLAQTTMAFDGFEALVSIQHKFSIDDAMWGLSYFQDVVYTFIPRALWTTKPIMLGMLLCEQYVYPELADVFKNVGTYPIGYVGEAFLNFWYLGLFLIPFLLGTSLAWVERAVKGSPHLTYPVIVAGIMVGDSIGLVRGLGPFTLELLTMPTLYAFLRILRPRHVAWQARAKLPPLASRAGAP